MTEKDIENRLYNVLPFSSMELQKLFSMSDIIFNNDITETACVTCNIKPTLYLNKDFVKKYCESDEHLFMLIMHELYHIILGHTTLFKKHTIIDNIAFDAIINSILCKTFRNEEYTSFFKKLNSSKNFPSCILRPKDKDTPEEYVKLLDLLYEDENGTYYDVYEILKKEITKIFNDSYILLGNHNENNSNNPLLKEILDEIINKWPRPNKEICGRDLGGMEKEIKLKEDKTTYNKKKLIKLLEKASIYIQNSNINKKSINNEQINSTNFIPNYKDRVYPTKKTIYKDVLLYNNTYTLDINSKHNNNKTFIYLDVSGSVIDDVKKIINILNKPYRNKECKIFTFSTEVYEQTPKEIEYGKIKTTCGTDINCIFDHLFKYKKQINKIIILTDGDVGNINKDNLNNINKRKIKIYLGLFGNTYHNSQLEQIVKGKEEFIK